MVENATSHEPLFPGGTVTFLFTDIEGSTQLLEQLRDQYEILISRHHKIIRDALTDWDGREVDTQGDAFFVVFPKASAAVCAVLDIQRAIHDHDWPKAAQVRVRMGLHTGEPWLVEEGYMGMDVHRAARIGHVGHGGQVLLSATTTSLVLDELPEGVSLLDLGRHRLKDMRRPEPIHQLVIEGLPSEFPPLNSLEALPALQPLPTDAEAPRVPREVGPSPYRGLAAFREADSELFFGREQFISQLSDAVNERQLVAVVVGPSGSGKSSTVFAGLLPQLRERGHWLIVETRPGSRPFQALASALYPTLHDTRDETERLVGAQKLAQVMRAGELSLFQIVTRALERHPESQRALLVIDQFEELFTHKPDPDAQRYFLDELIAAAEAGTSYRRAPLVILLTLRADFMGQALGHRPFADALQEGSLILGPMNRDELQAAVEKPAELAGAAFEAGLVQRILDDVGQEPGNLPLLEFALTLLWERMENGWMTHAAYDEISRVDGALARYAEEVWSGLDKEEQDAARSFFVQLVQPGEGTEDTRRVAKRSELAEGHWPMVQHLADMRLVVTGRDEAGEETVEVVHEALIRGWERLREWMIDERAFRTWQEGLRVAQRGWEASDRDEGALLRGAPLVMASEWLGENQAALAPLEKEYILASQRESQRREAQREARRQRELETAKKLSETERARAEEQAQSAQNLRRRAYVLGGVVVVAAILAIVAVFFARQSNENAEVAVTREAIAIAEGERADKERDAAIGEANLRATAESEAVTEANIRATAESEALNEAYLRATAQVEAEMEAEQRATAEAIAIQEREIAEEQTRLTRSRELALAALDRLEEDPELSILLALEALSVTYTREAIDALHQAVMASRVRGRINDHDSAILDVAYSPDGSWVATASPEDGVVKIRDAVSGELLRTLTHEDGYISWIAFSPDGKHLATTFRKESLFSDEPGGITVWDVDTGENLWTYVDAKNIFDDIKYSPDGGRLAAVNHWNGLPGFTIWNSDSGDVLLTVPGENDSVLEAYQHNIDFSPDGQLLSTSSSDTSRIVIYDAATGLELTSLNHPEEDGEVKAVAFHPDGQQLATKTYSGNVYLWDIESGDVLATATASLHAGLLTFSPDKQQLVVLKGAERLAILDAVTLEEMETLPGYFHGWHADFSSDGRRLIAVLEDGDAIILDLSIRHELPAISMVDVGFSRNVLNPDNSLVAGVDDFGRVYLRDAPTGELMWQRQGHDEWSGAIDFSPEGTSLATGGDDGTVAIWETMTGAILKKWTVMKSWVNRVAYSPDGSQLAIAGQDGSVTIYDVHSDTMVLTLSHGDPIWAVAYNQDGNLAIGNNADQSIDLWNPSSGKKLLSLDAPQLIRSIVFDPAGEWLVGAGGDSAIIYDLTAGEARFTLEALDAFIADVNVNHDGSQLAITGTNVRIWDPDTGELLQSLPKNLGWAVLPAFSPDGKHLFFTTRGTLWAYTLDLEELKSLARSRLTRELAVSECALYHIDLCPAGSTDS